jgi:hypothetical protein
MRWSQEKEPAAVSENVAKILRLYWRLSEDEKKELHEEIRDGCQACAGYRHHIYQSARKHAAAKRRRNSHPRNSKRDAKIWWKHRIKKLTYGQISKQHGMTRDAVKKAFHRFNDFVMSSRVKAIELFASLNLQVPKDLNRVA